MNKIQKQNPVELNYLSKNGIIIFIKNPQLGKVKTRLAATLGDELALEIYHLLMSHTEKVTNKLTPEKYLYYSDFVDENDIWDNKIYHKSLQFVGSDLGLKMAHAFSESIRENCSKVLIIGSDCLELTEAVINEAFMQLSDNEVVIGPANDGGYYLIGFDFQAIGERCREVLQQLFIDKEWSHENVFQDTINICETLNLKCFKLSTLIDIDEESDLIACLPLLEDTSILEDNLVLQELVNS
jgi:uncharacterized protein